MTTKQDILRTNVEYMRDGLIRHMMYDNDFSEEDAKLLADTFIRCKYARLVGNGWQYVGSMADKEQQELILDMIKNP